MHQPRHDSIAVFSRDSVSGLIKPKGHIPARGKWPRDFNITPEGDYLIVANQNSDSLISYRLDEKTGLAEFTGYSAVVEEPVCVTFVNAR